MTSLRRLLGSVDNGVWGNDPTETGGDLRCVRAADFDFVSLRVDLSKAPMRDIAEVARKRLELRPGDIVLEKSGGGDRQPVGRAVLFDEAEPAVCSNFAARIRPSRGVDPRYLCFLLAALYFNGATEKCVLQTTGIQNLDMDAWLKTSVPNIDFTGQRRIADFLDDQIARIDNIVAARRAQVLGSVAVVDAMWSKQCEELRGSQAPLRRVAQSIADGPFGSSLKSSHYVDFGTRVIRLGNIGINRFKDGDRVFVPSDYAATLKQHDVQAGDVLMAGLGDSTWPLGRSTVAPYDLGPAIVKADCYRIRLTGAMRPKFAAWYLSSPPARDQFALLARGSTRARLNTNLALNVEVPIVSIREQDIVIEKFESQNETEVSAQSVLATGVHLMQEMKRSLITAAVTGEFDVSTADGSQVPV